MRRLLLLSSALSALLFAACGSCDRQPPPEPSAPPPGAERTLAPLPKPPEIEVPKEAVPGTATELAVVAARPQGRAEGDVRPTITFSAPVKALGTIEPGEPAPATLTPPVKGAWKWLGSASVEFVPAEPLPMSTEFQVTVAPGLAALNGARLASAYTFSFQTPAPELQQLEPWHGYRWVAPDQLFSLTFNQPVRELTAHAELRVGVERRKVALTLVKEIDVAEEQAARLRERGWRGDGAREGFRNRQRRYELKAAEPLPANTPVQLVVSSALPGAEGPLTLGSEKLYDFKTRGPMEILGLRACGEEWDRCSWGPLVIATSNEADPASLKGRLKVTPNVEIDWDAVEVIGPQQWAPERPPQLRVPGRFRPGTRYEVRIAAGLTDAWGQKAGAHSGELATADLEPTFMPGSSQALLESTGDRALPVETANISSVEAELWRVTPEEAATLLLGGEQFHKFQPPRSPVQVTLDVSGARNVQRDWPLSLDPALEGATSGLVLAQLWAPEVRYSDAQHKARVFAQVSDLAVHARFGAANGVLWVTRLSDGKVVPGARLRVLDRTGAERWSGVSDADGLATIPGLVTLIPEKRRNRWSTPPALAVAELDGQLAVTASTWNEGLHPSAFDLPVDFDYDAPKPLGVLFSDRGIYRPGDEVFVRGLARSLKLGKLTTPQNAKARVVVRSSRGEEIFKTEVPVTAFGSFSTKLTLPAEAALGGWEVQAQVGSAEQPLAASFRVEEYRPPQFQVDVDVAKKEVVAGEALSATVLARYLHGGAMADASVRWSMAAQSQVEFTPHAGQGFTFGPQTWLLDDGAPEPTRTLSAGGEARTDEKGFVSLALGTPTAPGGQAWEYTVEAEVADVNRQRLANRATLTVHPAAWYVGLRTSGDGFFEVGKAAGLEAIAVALDGERKAGAAIELELRRREWKSIRRKGAGSHWYFDTEPVESKVHAAKLVSAAEPVKTEFTPAEPGFYIAEARTKDEAGREQVTRTYFYVVGPGWVSWQRDATDRIELIADKRLYDVGETAKVLIKNPWPEAEAIVTVEREGVRSVRHLKLTAAATVVEVPIGADAVPNLYVGAMLFRGRVKAEGTPPPGEDPGRPSVAVGYTQLKVEKKSKRLQVAVTPDAAEKRPGQKVSLSLKVTDAAGNGAKSELAVWVVDEGVLRLTGYQAPDPVEALHPQRGLAVFTGEPLLHLVLRRNYSEKGATAGGSGGTDASGAGFRSRFKTTVFFAPHVETDDAGVAKVEFTLPDNLTTFRIMALAATAADASGFGQSKVVVSKPLLALPALPRAARVGDAFEAGVVLHGKGKAFPEVKVTAQAEGLTLTGAAEQTVSLADGKPREVRFRFTAQQPGTAKLRFSIEGAGERDGVEQTLPVTLPVSTEAVAVWGDTADKVMEGIVPPEGVRPDTGGLQLTLASTALGGYDAAMRQLVEYPYGCVEQLSSRLVPFIALRELKGQFQDAGGMNTPPANGIEQAWLGEAMQARFASGDPDEVVRTTVRAIEQLQNTDGGYRYWSSSDCSAGWASAYAVLALARAQEVGYPVDAEGLKRGKAFVGSALASGQGTRCGYAAEQIDAPTRVFALYVLARSGAPKPSWYGELYAKREGMPLFAKAMLADAMFVGGGDRGQAKQLLQELLNHAKESAAELHFEEKDPQTYAALWSSDTRTTAIALQTLTTISPDHPYVGKMARYLGGARQKSGEYRNTQEAAFSLMALAELVRTKERQTPDFVARVTLGSDELAEVPFKGRSLEPKKVAVPIARLAEKKGKLPLQFAKQGEGVLYYGAQLRYAPAELPLTPLDRGLVVQRWFEPYTGGGQARRFFAGELVRVRVRLGSHMARRNVAIEVPLPAGLEPVDTGLASTAQLPQSPADEEGPAPDYEYEGEDDLSAPASPWAERFYSPFNHTELRDDRVLVFADELPPGVHVTSFVARATTPGDFVLPPAKAEEMYTPEIFGRSDGGRFEVVLPSPVASRTE